jgi:hypothetical protein
VIRFELVTLVIWLDILVPLILVPTQ